MQIQQTSSKAPGSKLAVAVIAVVLAVLLVGGGLMLAKGSGTSSMNTVKKDKYQAVFLTNGQVYFGKVANAGAEYVQLSDIYYLQVQQTVQPDQQKKDSNQQPQVSLAKLGSELHSPEDVMYISRDQVLFWENLKDDGKVVQAIKTDKAK